MSVQQQVGLAVCVIFYAIMWSGSAASWEQFGPNKWNVSVVLSPIIPAVLAALGVFG